VAKADPVVIRDVAPHNSLDVEHRGIEVTGLVLDQASLLGMEQFDSLFELGQEMGSAAAYQIRDAVADEELAAIA